MAKPKSVTINLTAKQRAQLRSITGVDHKEIKVEAKAPLAAKTAPRVGVRAAALKVGFGDGAHIGQGSGGFRVRVGVLDPAVKLRTPAAKMAAPAAKMAAPAAKMAAPAAKMAAPAAKIAAPAAKFKVTE